MKNSGKLRAFPIVAIGASAGGLHAFEELLSALPPAPGTAFVLVPHLAPQFKSHLTEILARSTKLPVREVKNGDKVFPNQIYILPPNRAMLIKGGVLRLSSIGQEAGARNPIDRFFLSLAGDQKERAIGVLLSGEGSDGTAGLQAIKDAGGATFAQNNETAAHLSMPQSAAVSGCVDFILSPAEIGKKLGAARGGGERQYDGTEVKSKPKGEEVLGEILALLRARKGIDFEFYKRSTLRRRIQRRMTLSRLRDPEKYLRALKTDRKEIELLYGDILISVTSFFREPESFQALKASIYPRLLKNRLSETPIRIWVPGCSTGEEAYSHAMNLVEFLGNHASSLPFQVFATDVNPAVIEKARAGLYTKKMAGGVSPERLRRFFIKTEDGYRVVPAIRERCVFAVQNLVQDPPFTNLDLISCRNLLIYLGPTLQDKALQIFQYALKPRGILMLGRSETIGDHSGRFSPLDLKGKVFFERTTSSKTRLDFIQSKRLFDNDSAFSGPERGKAGLIKSAPDSFDVQGQLDGILPARYIPNGVIVNGELEILRFLGNTSSYLRPAPGTPSLNLRRMASAELLLELRAAIHAAKKSACAVRKDISAPQSNGAPRRVRIEVLPSRASDLHHEYFVVLFEEIADAEGGKRQSPGTGRGKDSRRVVELKEDLAISSEHLKAIIEEQESTNAKLKSSNEDLLSSNEELQSINEEYETTKEELQSSNEELISSTEEVARGNQILSRANNDLSNLLANINIPIVLLDPALAVHRFTPSAEKVLGLSPEALGRSIADIKLPLRLPNLKELLLNVVKTGRVQTQEVQGTDGRWYYLIVRPYRTDKSKTERSRTEGAVMALVDIQDRKAAEKTVLRLAAVVRDSNDSVIVVNLKDRITAWNKGAQKMYGYTEAQALGMNISRLMPKHMHIRARDLLRVPAAPIETRRRTKDGRILDVLLTVTVLRDDKGQPAEIAKTERDITARKRAERDHALSEHTVLRLAAVVRDSNDAVIVRDLKDRITAWNKGAQKMYGYAEAQALGMDFRRLVPGSARTRTRDLLRLAARRKNIPPTNLCRLAKDGRVLDVHVTVTVLRDDKGRPAEIATTERDITEQKRSEKTVSRLATVVLDSNDAVTVCDLNDRITAWNKGAQKMYGYTEAQALGMSIRRLMPKNMRLKARDLVQVSAAPIETQRRTKDGRTLDVLLTVTVLRDEKGELVEVATTERDITEHKRAERERKLSEKNVLRLANAVLDSNDGVIICDLKDRIIAWNKGAQKMYGYTEAQALGMSIRRLMPKNKLIRARELVRVSAAPVEIQRRTKDGRTLDVLLTVTVLRDEKDQPVEVATTERDITEQKRAERERKLSEKNVLRLANAVLDSNDGVIICDLKDRIIAWNKGAQKMYGYTEAQALGMSIRRLMPENKLMRARELVQVSAAPIETQRRTKNGRLLDVLLTVTVLRDEKGQPVEVATTERDITEQKRADQEFRRLHASVISAQETERKRLARELHDGVGQILSGVKFRLQALPGKMTLSGDGEAKILKVGGFLDHAIAEIRRVSQNLMPSELVDLGLGPALSTLCREFKERAGIHVTVRDEGAPASLSPEMALAFFRIAQEALNNIGKHSKATMVVVALSRRGKEIVLSVSDNGVGFKPGGPRQPAGRGFGLGNMRQRAESVGGSIEIHSTPGAGTTLNVRAPLTGLGGYTA
ncbi:MAG: PAS domain S-box protein [Elusimicrobia bacterium]|nr:PAS domain S-box protein [Elusimicrobiota bacterium]